MLEAMHASSDYAPALLASFSISTCTCGEIVAVISALKSCSKKNGRDFASLSILRAVAIGRGGIDGRRRLMGSEVNLIFCFEKLASSPGEPCALSEAA